MEEEVPDIYESSFLGVHVYIEMVDGYCVGFGICTEPDGVTMLPPKWLDTFTVDGMYLRQYIEREFTKQTNVVTIPIMEQGQPNVVS
ncbi:hypothetical protein UFOVP1537_20 [uncultured Caudovirales phage]|uniref:Uncharacterized protein n=2 Tax=root TaxID=1 RepID=A0A6J5PYZ7_9CAUD|nr:hypothetical protein UFOVP825_38 [uncultured Caudovirales phage]CAB4171224.1 hypothetical protein UFOVP915_20 [uncultured Caudovirales phage]CAB4177220.1 hypothetical protein UFOVP1000_37 [uncultured Caudovirales phage]CAB4182630.1 hypothetical protein UFOVP1092_12 [uncultured Caudovirales phage]CAB4187413.1 hypothetical protein UFOVP1152_16 [uncultured Caudovirales phage]